MSEHAVLAPSSADRWVNCAASVRLEKAYPETEESEAAKLGAAWHWAAFMLLSGNSLPDVAFNGVPIDEEMARHAKEWAGYVETHFRGERHYEERIEIPVIHAQCWGTPDVVGIDRPNKTIRVGDGKYGHGLVEAFEFWQGLCYAAGLTDGEPDWRFEIMIYQPRGYHPQGTIRTWAFTASELNGYVRQLRAAAEAAMGNNPEAVPGPWCRYCKARRGCTALRNSALHAVDTASGATPLDLSAGDTGMELSLLTRAYDLLRYRIEGLQAQAEAAIRSGENVFGWGLESSTGREKWVKPIEEIRALGDLMGVTVLKGPELITPAQARKAGLDADTIKQYAARGPGEAKLVPVSTADARRAFGSPE